VSQTSKFRTIPAAKATGWRTSFLARLFSQPYVQRPWTRSLAGGTRLPGKAAGQKIRFWATPSGGRRSPRSPSGQHTAIRAQMPTLRRTPISSRHAKPPLGFHFGTMKGQGGSSLYPATARGPKRVTPYGRESGFSLFFLFFYCFLAICFCFFISLCFSFSV